MPNFFDQAIEQVLRNRGYNPISVDFETAQRLKDAARAEDDRLVAEGLATPEEIQRRNSMIVPGETIEVIDYGSSLG